MYLNSQVQEAHGYREEAAIDVEYSTHGASRKYTFLSLTFYLFFLLFINYYTTFSIVFFFFLDKKLSNFQW
jgi:hypothetical protein